MKKGYEVRVLSQDEYPLWDELVDKSPQGTIFHMSQWIKSCADLSSKKEIIFGFFNHDNLEGGCSVFSTDNNYYSSAVSISPMNPYGGYIFSPNESTQVREKEQKIFTIIKEIYEAGLKNFDHIHLINSPGLLDIRPFVWMGWKSSVYYTYVFYLDGTIEEKISKKVRNTVRKAQKLEISVKKETNYELYYYLFSKTYEKQGLRPPVSKEYLIQLIDMIISSHFGEMWIARTVTGEPAAAEIVIWDNKRAHRWSAVSDNLYSDTGATSLLLFHIFKDLQTKGFHEINLMAGNTPNLTKYISSFNPVLLPYYSVETMNLKCKIYFIIKSFYCHSIFFSRKLLSQNKREITDNL